MDLTVYLLALKKRAFFNGYATVYIHICIDHFIQNLIVDDVMMNYSFSCKLQVLMILGGVNH